MLSAAILILICISISFLWKRPENIFFLLFLKIFFLIFAHTAIFLFFQDGIAPVNPDQEWYLSSSLSLMSKLGGLSFWDYSSELGLQNFLYNVILAFWGNLAGSLELLDIRLINLIFSIQISFLCFKFCSDIPNKKLRKQVFLVTLFIPTLNFYSLGILRDVLISLIITFFFLSLKRSSLAGLSFSCFVIYFLRSELVFIFAATFLFFFLNKHLNAKWAIVLVIFFLLFLKFNAEILFPSLVFFLRFDIADLLIGLPRLVFSILGLDFLLFDRSTTQFALSFSSLLMSRLIFFDSLIIPLMFFYYFFKKSGQGNNQIVNSLMFFLLVYSFGYHIRYGMVFVRHLFPIYPIMVTLSLILRNSTRENENSSYCIIR